ncbi:hypothetical protein PHLCEN_2v6411 [Hermanssonia centrifuga]|uniref:ABC transporter domain-containing protein n=1 Tax=Hermanssonia centrifuga TaxID=98765 RepID=A0A2R6NZK1_9APHY|nr:hypothetical protein PHLCEN_2v6411 [Hermanssonia centrifuga]
MIIWWIRSYNDFEVSGNSLERIQQYLVIEQEPGQQDHGVPPAVWPSSGEVRVENLSARYSPNGPTILENISFHIKAGQRVGIVGRTGSGKSTLTLALLRCIYTEGTVWYDGIPTHTVNLDALRSNITIIPQVPELLSGTLRQNLDMFNQYDDAALNDALRAAGLFSLQHLHNENRLTLDSKIASAGGNLSLTAPSATRHFPDEPINEFVQMVLDAGRLVEFNSPEVLLRDKESLLRALVEESADRDELLAMAQGGIII